MTQPNTTRRDLLRIGTSAAAYAAGAAIVVGGAALVSEARSAAPAVNPRLLKAIALRDRAEAAADRFDEQVHTPALKAFGAARDALPPVDPVPHESVATTFINAFGDKVRLSTERVGSTAIARRLRKDPTWADFGDEKWRQAHREVEALAERRNAIVAAREAERNAAVEQLSHRHGIDGFYARADALSDREYALWRTAMDMPATGLPDVLVKLEFAQRTRGSEMADTVLEAMHADIRRLAGEA